MLLFFLLFVPLFVLILLGVNMLVATNNPDTAKMAPYECGMPPASDARHKFQISFFLVAILFLIFGADLIFFYPLVVSLYHISFFGYWTAIIFILLLAISFIYELASGALNYASPRTSSPTKKLPQNPKSKISTGLRFYSTSSFDDSSKQSSLGYHATVGNRASNGKRRRDIGNPKYTREYKTNLSLTTFQAEVLVGLLLGDGSISAPVSKIGGHRLTIRHSMEQFDYLQHLHELFKALIVQPLLLGSNLDPRTKKTYSWCNLHTLSFPCLSVYRALFYNDSGVKIIPSNIRESLTAVGFAYWIADDGHYHKASGGVYLCTESFTLVEVELLINILKNKFNLKCKAHHTKGKEQYMIYIYPSQLSKLCTLGLPLDVVPRVNSPRYLATVGYRGGPGGYLRLHGNLGNSLLIFILLLTVGFIAELASGALDYAKSPSSSTKNSPSGKVPNGIAIILPLLITPQD